jgi:predicted site-specific integrase-resolvase
VRTFTRGELAEELGVSQHTIAKYVRAGWLPRPVPPTGCKARYSEEHLEAAIRLLIAKERNVVVLSGW